MPRAGRLVSSPFLCAEPTEDNTILQGLKFALIINYQAILVVPYKNYGIMGPKNPILITQAPTVGSKTWNTVTS